MARGKASGEDEEEEVQVDDDSGADTSGRVTLPPVVEEVMHSVCTYANVCELLCL